MANKPIIMSKIRHLMQLYFQGRSKLLIAEQTGIARNTVKKYIKEYGRSPLSPDELLSLSDKDLEAIFIKPDQKPLSEVQKTLFALFPAYDKKLRKKGMTRKILWERYREQYPDGLGRSQFNVYFTQWKSRSSPTMRIEHKAGDKLYVDFAGDKLHIVDKESGELINVEVFVAILGASQLTYVEAVANQQKENFIGACENALHYYGGVPAAIVPDNLKSAVTKSSKYEPVINETFADFAQHYSTAVLPARAYRPRDKALVENAVRIIYTRIYSKLHDRVFFSLEEINAAILIELDVHNNLLLTGRNYSRRQQFEEVERCALLALPELRYEVKQHRFVTVMKNGHVSLSDDKHYYSVPYRFIGKKVKLSYSRHTVEVYYNYERIALHERLTSQYQYSTDKEHMASSHRFVSDWNPDRFVSWASAIHEDVKRFIEHILDNKQHPEQNYKSCVGILSYAKKVSKDKLIKACQRALSYEVYNFKIIEKILQNGLEEQEDDKEELPMPAHENIRGERYYE